MTNWKKCFDADTHYSEFRRKRRDPRVPDALQVYAQDLQLPSRQDLVAGRVSCNDPRVTDAPVDPTKLQRFAPGVSSRDFLFCGCLKAIELHCRPAVEAHGLSTLYT
jgi:hypothetical protein